MPGPRSLCGALILTLVSLGGGAGIASAARKQVAKECCFQHKSYSGTCHVTPAQGETCASILSYLNTAGTVGKAYCGGSTIRGGWRAVRCARTPQPKSNPA